MPNGASSGPSGIITRSYKPGSIIYFDGDKSDYIYILKAGKIVLTSIKLDTGEEVKEEVRQGEFFGVKSSLGKYPREETAQTVGNTTVLVLMPADFERLVLKNSSVVRKMLRVFSNQLRRIVKMERQVLGESEIVNLDAELFKIGEYYYKAGVWQHAQYAYKRYMEYYPDAANAAMAMKRIRAIDSGEAMSEEAAAGAPHADLDVLGTAGDADSITKGSDVVDFDDSVTVEESPPDQGGERTVLSDEMDDFLSDEPSVGSIGPDLEVTSDVGSVFELDGSAEDSMTRGNFSAALGLYQKILSMNKNLNPEEKKIIGKAHFNAGRCLMELKKPAEALDIFSKILRNFPGSPYLKNAIFNIGIIFESANQKEKAITYYNKVLNMPPKDKLNSDALTKIKNLQGK
jgi:tetratricopeptide (TPR) repeat protein